MNFEFFTSHFHEFYSDLQTTANGIRQDFKSAFEKYNKYQQEKASPIKPTIPVLNGTRTQTSSVISQEKISSPNIQNGNAERPIRYPAEDIRYKNKPLEEPIPVIQPVPLVSNDYQDEEDEDDDTSTEHNNNTPVSQCKSITKKSL